MSYQEIIFEDENGEEIKESKNETMLKEVGADGCIIKTEVFNLDMAYYLVRNNDLDHESKKRIQKMIKCKQKVNELEVTYKLGKNIKEGMTGRWIANRSIGLQGLSRTIRNALASDNYWDVDIVNCQVVLLLQLAQKYGFNSQELEYYCTNREKVFADMIKEKDGEITRDDLKERFIALLFGGYPKSSDPKWIIDKFYPEIKKLMANLATKFPDIYKRCVKSKPNNPQGSCCAHILQTEERKCLMALDEFLLMNKRSLDVLIHDGGYVRKLSNEKEFPLELLPKAGEHIEKRTGYKVKLALKKIECTIVIPSNEIPSERTYEMVKEKFEVHNFKCREDSRFYNTEKGLIIRSKDQLRVAYEDLCYQEFDKKGRIKEMSFLGGKMQRWFTDPEMRCYQKVRMLPPPSICDDDTFNSWSGFAVESIVSAPTDDDRKMFEIIRSHILLVCNNDTPVAEYVFDWFASVFQSPAFLTGTALLFKSKQGLGKNSIYRLLHHMIGVQYCGYTDNPELHLFGDFNSILASRLLMLVDEMRGSVGFKHSERLKGLITGDNIEINRKGQERITMPNHVHYMFFTNKDFPVKVDEDDRRCMLISSDLDPLDASYYLRLEEQIIPNPQVQRLFYDFLMLRDVKHKNWKDRPETQFSKDSKEVSRPYSLRFVISFLSDKVVEFGGNGVFKISAKEFFSEFLNWFSQESTSPPFGDSVKLGIFVNNLQIPKFEKGKISTTFYQFDIRATEEWLLAKEYITCGISVPRFLGSNKK